MESVRVLIVEDDPMVMEINAEFVSKLPNFILVGKAFTGKEALSLIPNVRPHLILLYYFLPDINGLSLLQTIRVRNDSVDVILLTANREPQHIQAIFRAGAADYIIKPFQFDRFQSALETYFHHFIKFQGNRPFEQSDIDTFKKRIPLSESSHNRLPKGLNDRTLQQIMDYLTRQIDPLSSEEVAEGTGLARVTVRRYLDFLEKRGDVILDIQYGSVGRPINKYRI